MTTSLLNNDGPGDECPEPEATVPCNPAFEEEQEEPCPPTVRNSEPQW